MNSNQAPSNLRDIIGAFLKIAFLFIGYFACNFYEPQFQDLSLKIGHYTIKIDVLFLVLITILSTFQFIIILRGVLWDYYFPKKRKIKISYLLTSIIHFIIYLICIFFIISLFGYDIKSALTATGAVGVVLGFGLQRVILDVFVGISVDMDKSFQIGNWVHIKLNNQEIVGRIVQMTWRVVSIQTSENTTHFIPNNVFGNVAITNLSKPSVESEFELIYKIPHFVSERKVMTVLSYALEAAECTKKIFDSKNRIHMITPEGIHYKIKYWIRPDQISPGKARHLVNLTVIRFLRADKIPFAYSMDLEMQSAAMKYHNSEQEKYVEKIEKKHSDQSQIVENLRSIDLFDSLSDEELTHVASKVTEKLYNKDDVVCYQGDTGKSMFIIKRGFVAVYIQFDNVEKQVSVLIPEDFFGEMSMLTGAARTATVIAKSRLVVYEIQAEIVLSLMQKNEELYSIFAKTLAERTKANTALRRDKAESLDIKNHIRDIENKIINFAKKILKM